MLPFLSKIFDKSMCGRLDSYQKSNNILFANLFGFSKNLNTSDTNIEFLDYVYSSLDSKQSTIAEYLNFSKAFDTVNHNILMSRLLHKGVSGVMQGWFESYLSNRKQYVSVKTAVPLCQTLHWVFHKDLLWAQYFFFCISMTCIDPQITCVLFTDDTTVFVSDSDINNTHANVNRELVGVDNLIKANRLSLKVSKTSYMIISNQKNVIDIRIRDSTLTKISTVKILGITLIF